MSSASYPSSQLKIPCLGRPFNLGMLYDAHSDNIIPGKTLWDSKVLKSASQTTQQPSSNFEIIAEDTIQRKSSSLDIEANLKLSLMGGMVKVSGAAKYLDDKKCSEQQARVTLKYSSTTHFEQLTMEQLGTIQYQRVLEDHHATHVVTGIVFGSDAFFVFDRSLSANEKLQVVHGNMEAKIACIPIEGSASLDMKEADKIETEKLHCKFYGDLILPSNPSTFDEAVKVYKELPQLLENKSVAKVVYLYPLSELDNKPQQIVRWISSDLIAQVEEIMESFHKVEMRANDLMRHSLCSKFADVERQFSTLLILMKRFQINFSKHLANLLPSIRSSGAEEKQLADLISSIHSSPFNSKEMEAYLKRKSDREIKQLAQFVKNMTKEPKVQCAFPDSDCSLTTLTTDDEIEYVICFAFNVTTDTSPYIKSLESYLQMEKKKSVVGKEWYENPDQSKALRLKSKQFTQLVQATSSNSDGVAFVMTDRNEETDSRGPAIIRYTNGVPEIFEPPGKPGTPKATNISTDSVDLTWAKPEQGVDFVTSYRVLYRSGKDPDHEIHSIHCKDTARCLHVKDLIPGNEYQFTVQALSDPGVSIESDICLITTVKRKRLADMILQQCRREKSGNPAIYRLPLTKAGSNPTDGLYKYAVGIPSAVTPKPEKVLMVVGATGAGKSTLINGMANYVMGVNWNDTFRFKAVKDEGNRTQAESQTKDITAYTFYSMNLPYNLTIIDTPGFGDTGGIERDKYIAAQIKKFFSGRDRVGIDQLHGIGFVTQASLARLTPTQEYIFGAVLSMFGKDVKDNIFLLITFADANDPPVIAATKAANIPYTESFLFNNSALYATNTSTGFNSMFWDMGLVSFRSFFDKFQKATPRSLALTREVLQEREQLENLIPGLQQQVKVGLSQLDVIQQEEKILEQHEADIAANKGFKYEVDVEKFKKIPQANTVTTTCLVCNFTCHPSCAYSNDSDKQHCCAMNSHGYCTVCPSRCYWSKHANLPYHIEYYTVKEPRTHEDLKKRYESAKNGKERVKEMVAKKEERLHRLQATVFSLIEKVTESIKRLDEIALKPNPLSEIEYLDLLIQSEQTEAKSGWQRRVAQYQKIRQEAELIKKLPGMTIKDVQSDKSWWQFWK